MIALSRLLITGPITDQIPRSVIAEILFFHHSRNTSELLSKKVVTVNDLFSTEDAAKIAAFINPYEKWDIRILMKAWQFIQAFMGKSINIKWTLENVGLQTNEYPYSLNACMLYRICLEWSIPTTYKTTIEDMITMIHISLIAPKEIRQVICLNIKANFDDSKDNEKLITKLVHLRQRMTDYNSRMPGTNAEAIALAALQYNTDISYSAIPIIDYYSKKICNCYHDIRLRKIYTYNKRILNLTKTFNPLFPMSYYSRACLESLSHGYGFTGSLPNIDMYLNLQLNHTIDNFYHGWQEKLLRDTSAILFEDISGRDDIVCFGNFLDGFLPYIVEELVDLYSTKNMFSHPNILEEELPPRAVITLQTIANSISPELSNILRRIKILDTQIDDDLKKVIHWYTELTVAEQNYAVNLLTKLLDLGMYMRGWKGKGDSYPIKRRPYTPEVDGFVTIAFWPVYEEYSNPVGKRILDLPLYRHTYGTWKRSREIKDGITIFQRVAKVKNNADIYACIRMSSNWFICSAYKYLTLFGLPEPFNLNEIDYIS